MPDQPNKLPTAPVHIPQPQFPTTRATAVLCEVDGGAFSLVLSDLRPVQAYTPQDRFEGNSAFVEVGRFALSPVAFLYLKATVAQAEQWYIDHFGPLPDLETLHKRIYDELPERRGEIEQRMGFRQPGAVLAEEG